MATEKAGHFRTQSANCVKFFSLILMFVRIAATGFCRTGFRFFGYQCHIEQTLLGIYIFILFNLLFGQVPVKNIIGKMDFFHFYDFNIDKTGSVKIIHKIIYIFCSANASC